MVVIQVKIPSIRAEFDFRCNEKSMVSDIINDLIELVRREETCEIEDEEKLELCDVRHGYVLHKKRCLQQYHVQNGTCLALV